MNATGKIMLTGAVAAFALTGESWGQAGGVEPTTRPITREDVDALLLQAKSSLQRGDLAAADHAVAQAESAGVRYPMFYKGDTPSRLRRAVDEAQRRAPKQADPFLSGAGRNHAGPAAPRPFVQDPDGRIRPLPVVDGAAANEPVTTKQQAEQLVAAARAALRIGDYAQAEEFAVRASRLNLPEAEFAGAADSPARLAWDLQQARLHVDPAVAPATAEHPIGDPQYGVQALHVPETDTSENQHASALTGPRFAQVPQGSQSRYGNPGSATTPDNSAPSAADLMEQGESALKQGDLTSAWRVFQQAADRRAELSGAEQARLDAHLQMLTTAPVNQPPAELAPEPTGSSMFESADEAQRVLARQMSADVGNRSLEAKEIRGKEPKRALEMLKETREQVRTSQLADDYRRQLLRRVDAAIAETEKYINDNRAEIELDEKNAAVLAQIERDRLTKEKLEQKKGELVNEFHRLQREQRFAEAEQVAKRLYEMLPDDEVAVVVWNQAKIRRREMANRRLRDLREETNFESLADVDRASAHQIRDGAELSIDAEYWKELEGRRGFSESATRLNPREIEIREKLTTPVQLRFIDRPLSEVIDTLSELTGVNIHLDPRGMSQEGVSSETTVSIDLNSEVMLKSALNLILEPLHLKYLIKDEVLKITSQQIHDGEIKPVTYYVADLVTPIPNFVPSNNIGLQGMINDAYAALGYGVNGIGGPSPTALVSGPRPGGLGQTDQDIYAQQLSGPQFGAAGQGSSIPLGGGGPSPGGGAQADFDSLIDLIISTVASETWAENGGGEAEIRPYVNNLSLVISQTQAVHEEIADLLEQLRRLQDLQITIEVRFIQLNDNFFERIGIDFDVNINDRTFNNGDLSAEFFANPADGTGPFETPRSSATVGIQQPIAEAAFPTFTADLDIPFRQGSFGVTAPTFGGFTDPAQAASFGFAILSDIEAYFLINAAQGDSRTNILNAPKVTLFNGQTAFIADASQTPFVISVIPVVGEFAAAQQPVIVVLSEGTMMNIQAVVSDDRRYVRLTVVPFFSEIGDVDTFQFEGSTTTDTSSSSTDADDDGTNEAGAQAAVTTVAGTTVQLPTFQFVAVSTTVSVPDGGTVLLGGIKRLSEGRDEAGVPLLSKLPYINRLFRNVGIGRETDSLMLMVTPRIIIHEEEEEKLGLGS